MKNSRLWRGGILSLLLFLSIAINFSFAQERTVTGTVTSEDGSSIPGVNIVIQGTLQGTVTDVDGNYTIEVPGPDAVLVFSSVGFETTEVTVGDKTTIDVTMPISVTPLDEVLVIGYGTQKKKEVTSSITSVKSDEFNKGFVNNPEKLIQGKVAGLSISKVGGNPNEGYNIRLRGLSTIGAQTQPLFVIDGVIGASLDNVDPNDIEAMDVLKDGSAAAIYGTRGSSGVIIVTTKKGREGKSQINYNGYATAEMLAKGTNVMNADEWRELSSKTGLGTDFGGDTDWFDETTRNTISHVHNLSLSGGADNTTYRASLNYRDNDGVMLNTGNTKLNARLNLTQKALNDRLTMDLNVGASQQESQYGFTEAFRYATLYNPTAPVKSDDAAYDIYDGYFQQVLFDYYNPVQILEQNINEGTDKRLNVSLKGAFDITDELTVDAFYSVQNENFLRGQYYDKNSYWQGMDNNGMAERNTHSAYNQLFETTANWAGDVTSSVNLTALGGYSYQNFIYEGFHARGGDFITDAFTYNNLSAALDFNNGLGDIDSYKNSNKLIAFFGRINLNVTDTYFLTASARYEGSSRFGKDNKWGLFPAIGGGVELSGFINASFIDNLKLRANYGITGNQPASSYLSLLRLGPGGNFFYNGEFVPGFTPVSNANTDLGWEKKTEIDVGVDFSFFESTLFGSFDFYTRSTTDLLFEYQVPVPPNLYDHAWLNMGEIKSSGLELALTWNAIDQTDFTYSTTITSSYSLENTLVSLSGSYNGATLEYGVRDLHNLGSPGQNQVPLVRVEEGKPIGQLLAHTFQEIDADGTLILKDTNEDGTVDPDDRVIVGNGLPDFQFGFGNDFTYKNWDMSIYFRGVLGHDIVNTYRAFYEVPMMVGSYNLPKTAADMKNSETDALMNNSTGLLSTKHIEDGSFVSLDNMSIGYNFDLSESTQFRRIRVYISGNNLFYITGYSGVDPNPRYEDWGNPLVPGIDRRNTWFRTRSVSLGVNIGF